MPIIYNGETYIHHKHLAKAEAEVERLRKALHRSNRDCENMHHDSGEYHGCAEPCPVEAWVNDALA